MWTPFFSVHFPTSDSGHDAYRLLKEFSLRRQLEPPKEMITMSEEFLARKRPKSSMEAEEFDDKWKRTIGFIMNQKYRARTLMDQKATSVADIAQVLEIVRHKILGLPKPEPQETATESAGEEKPKKTKISNRAKRRIKLEQLRQEKLAEAAKERIRGLESQLSSRRASYKIAESTEETQHFDVPIGEARLFWIDPKDAQYAPAWPAFTVHGPLNRSNEHVMDYHLGQIQNFPEENTGDVKTVQ